MNWFNKKCQIEFVKCEDCRCLGYKEDFQKVKKINEYTIPKDSINYIYYCPKDKKPYSVVSYTFSFVHYYSNLEVDENGIPLGFKKLENHGKTHA